MKTIKIGFSRASGFLPLFSWAIMLAQRTNYSHCYIRYTDEVTNKDMVFQASGLEVNLVGYSTFLTKEIVVEEYPIQISDQAFQELMGDEANLLGQPYSMTQILNSAIYLLCHKAPLDKYIAGWDCAKLAAFELQKDLGWKIPEDLDVITPKDLRNIIKSSLAN